jgi:DNA-binding HxlR family transcriptional regulator
MKKMSVKTAAQDGCAHCPCMADCPLDRAMRIIGGQWKVPLLCALHQDGPARYSELKRKIRGITNTVLASALKELEEAGLVARRQFMEMPVRVEYSVTAACNSLLPILRQLAGWGVSMARPEKS